MSSNAPTTASMTSSSNGFDQSTAATTGNVDAAKTFSIPDYIVFVLSLVVPLLIGVFFFVLDRKKSTTQNFLMGERSINFVAVALSIMASLLNGIFVIGIPAEVHYFGVRVSYYTLGLFLVVVAVSHFFAAKYQAMKFTSAYEYLERRYNYATRAIASFIFCVSVIVFLAVVLYAPALAFAQVTGLSIYVTIVLTSVICTIYTTIGGMKAVVWTDALQMVILLVGLIVIAALGSHKVGGGDRVWQIAVDTGRINLGDSESLSVDPRTRHTLWTQMFGGFVTTFGLFISNQMTVQRYMSVATKRQAQATLYVTFLFYVPLVILITFVGLALHAAYSDCEPLIKGSIEKGDQIMLHYIMDLLGEYQGVPGLLTASVFAAALSSVSSVCNSLAAVCLEDFIIPGAKYWKQRTVSEAEKRWIAVLLVVFFGLPTIGLSFIASTFTSKLIQASGTIWGVLGSPLGGIFVMGFFMPFCNSAGAISGLVGGTIIALWVSIGAIVNPNPPQALSLIPENWNWTGCVSDEKAARELAKLWNVTTSVAPTDSSTLMDWYKVSYAWYGVIGMGSCIVIGVVVSLSTTCAEKCRPRIARDLMCLCCCEALIFGRQLANGIDNKAHVTVDAEEVKVVVGHVGDSCKLSEPNGVNGLNSAPITMDYDNLSYIADEQVVVKLHDKADNHNIADSPDTAADCGKLVTVDYKLDTQLQPVFVYRF